MEIGDIAMLAGHFVLVLTLVLLVGHLGRFAARMAGQPQVIGEILFGLLSVPAVILLFGQARLPVLLPDSIHNELNYVGQLGLALFLVGITHELRRQPVKLARRAVRWVTAGAVLGPLGTGVLMTAWLLVAGGAELRDGVPPLALGLVICAVLVVTAVPVLARILVDRNIATTAAGRLSLSATMVVDPVAWLLLTIAAGVVDGGFTGVVVSLIVLAGVVGLGSLLQRVLRAGPVLRVCARRPTAMALATAGVSLGAALGLARCGLTGVVGALLVGFAIPIGDHTDPWFDVVARVVKVGRLLLPVFFVVAGFDVFRTPLAALPWPTAVVATALAIIGKVGGGYLGGMMSGVGHWTALTVGVLVNTRGLTEIVVLQTSYSLDLIGPSLFIALLCMALMTTGLTGPLLSLIERIAARQSGHVLGPGPCSWESNSARTTAPRGEIR